MPIFSCIFYFGSSNFAKKIHLFLTFCSENQARIKAGLLPASKLKTAKGLINVKSIDLPYLVVDEQLDGVVPPLDENDLVGLARHAIREWGADAWTGAGLEPHADGEGVHLWEALLDAPVQIISTKREGHLEVLW